MRTVTYKEATEILGVSYETVRQAVSRGVLVRVHHTNRKNVKLSRDQVELFVGKPLSLNSLDDTEMEKWEEYKKEVFRSIAKQYSRDSENADDNIQSLIDYIKSSDEGRENALSILKLLSEAIKNDEVPQGVPFVQRV